MFTYTQTETGMYNSKPQPQHVAMTLDGDYEWEQEYADRGHGEYIDNVHTVAEYAQKRGKTHPAQIAEVLNESAPELR